MIDEAQRAALLELARRAVAAVAGGHAGAPPPSPPELDGPAALFVTLRVAGELRGCIGSFEPQPSLWRAVYELAEAAATRDPRFPPITAAELPQVALEISVLSAPHPITSPAEIVPGRHGIEVRNGARRGVLLPQVATEHGLDAETFLGETCRKAGLPTNAWRDPATHAQVFEAEIFSDRE